MDGASEQTLAIWREAGEWWDGSPPREVRRFIDTKGARRETISPLPHLEPVVTDTPEVPAIRRLKDEKMALAMGYGQNPDLSHLRRSVSTPQPAAALHCLSGYAYGMGTMIAAEIPAFAAARGYRAALLADPFSLTGAVEFAKTAQKVDLHPLIGASFEMPEGGRLVLVARNRIGYRSLSRLITECHLDEPRHYPLARWERLVTHAEGLLCLTGGDDGPLNRLLSARANSSAPEMLQRLLRIYGRDNVFVQIERSYLPWQLSANRRLLDLAESAGVLAVAGGPITHERPAHFPTQDTIVCIETLCRIDEIIGRKPTRDETQPNLTAPPARALNAERYFRTNQELTELFADRPDLIANTLRVVERCDPDILPGRTELPSFGENEAAILREVTLAGAAKRYPKMEAALRRRIEFELRRIERLGYARHFLIAWDMCEWARSQQIMLSGRGSVVDSVVAFCLGFSRIDAHAFQLHFDRFLPADGSKRPDIDIDFEARRRDDVRNYLADKYGRDKVATVAAIGTYGTRGIIREVGKVMNIPPESLSFLTRRLHRSVAPDRLERALRSRPELRNGDIPRERFHWVFRLAERMMDLPRNIRSHSSGVVISQTPIADTVPVMFSGVEDVRILQWDKRSAKRCFDKFDVLCLRGNDVLSDTERRAQQHDPDFTTDRVPLDDPEIYRTMRSGQLIGVPQSASPAMRQAHIRIGTSNLKDAGIVQAGIRPGVGGAVKLNEYVARRKGKPYRLIHEDLEEILGPTLGIIVFQEQVDQLLQTFGAYTSDDAEQIREMIHKKRGQDYTSSIKEEMLARIVGNGYDETVANEVYEYVAGFQGYGFAEGHALAFAEISVRSIWCQQHYASEYFSALLGAQPAGYYGPCTIANEARGRGVQILRPDVNRSEDYFGVEDVAAEGDPCLIVPNGGIRVSLKQISGVSRECIAQILTTRKLGPFESLCDFVVRVRPDRDELEKLIMCGALDDFTRNRRALLWGIPEAFQYAAMVSELSGRLDLGVKEPLLPFDVEPFGAIEEAIQERVILGLDVKQHLMGFERERVRAKGGVTAAEAGAMAHGTRAFVVGNPIRLRFPPTSSGKRVMFFDLEDESGLLNVTCFDDVYQRDGETVICNPYITLWGEAQNRDGHIAFLAHRAFPYHAHLTDLTDHPLPIPVPTADFLMS